MSSKPSVKLIVVPNIGMYTHGLCFLLNINSSEFGRNENKVKIFWPFIQWLRKLCSAYQGTHLSYFLLPQQAFVLSFLKYIDLKKIIAVYLFLLRWIVQKVRKFSNVFSIASNFFQKRTQNSALNGIRRLWCHLFRCSFT